MIAAALTLSCGAASVAQTAKKAKQKAPEQAQEGEEPKAPEKKKKLTAAEAQQAVDVALKQLEAGKAEPAVQALTSTLAAGRLPPAIMAKALLYRGIAYRQQKKPALAIADLTSALWLKGGLGESERKDALGQRAAAYQEAGLTESGEAIVAAVPPPSRASTRTASASPSTGTWAPATTTAPASPPSASLAAEPTSAPAAEKQSSGGWNLFGNLFGAPASTPAPAPQSTASILKSDTEPVAVREAEPRSRPPRSTWARNTEVRDGAAATETASLPAKAEGKFRVQVGMVRTQDQAQALAGKVKGQYATALGQREPQIDQAVVGNMGSFYRVRVGPFASQQEGQAACARLKGSGLDCLVVVQ